jgi:hypothetical protein
MATVSTSSQIDPNILPYFTTGLERAKTLFLGDQNPSMYPGQTYVSPSEQTMTALQQQENIATQANPTLQAAQNAYLQSYGGLGATAAGGFLQGNPYQQQMIEAATRPLVSQYSNQILPGIASLYSKSGRYGSGSMQNALGQATESYGRALGDVSANIVGTQYDQERARQQQAMMGLTNVAQAAPSIYGQQYLPSQQLAQIGAQREAIAQQPLNEAMQRYSFGQQLPYQQLSGYLSSVYGNPTASYGTTTQNMSSNPTVGAIGGVLGGGLLGNAVGSAFGFPNLGAGIGALGGGLLGGFS